LGYFEVPSNRKAAYQKQESVKFSERDVIISDNNYIGLKIDLQSTSIYTRCHQCYLDVVGSEEVVAVTKGLSKGFEEVFGDHLCILTTSRRLLHTLGVDSVHEEQVQLVLASVLFQPLLAKTVGEMKSTTLTTSQGKKSAGQF